MLHSPHLETDAVTFRAPLCGFVDRPGWFVLRSKALCLETDQMRANCEQLVRNWVMRSGAKLKAQLSLPDKTVWHDHNNSRQPDFGQIFTRSKGR
jgi:hypothetical protein